jgi:hypothetical protein
MYEQGNHEHARQKVVAAVKVGKDEQVLKKQKIRAIIEGFAAHRALHKASKQQDG